MTTTSAAILRQNAPGVSVLFLAVVLPVVHRGDSLQRYVLALTFSRRHASFSLPVQRGNAMSARPAKRAATEVPSTCVPPARTPRRGVASNSLTAVVAAGV